MKRIAAALALFTGITSAHAAEAPKTGAKRAYFGDLHLHTALSFDAYLFNTNTLPEDSYRFARGEAVNYLGRTIKRKAPLDFLAVTDHSEFLGVMRQVDDDNGPFKDTKWHALLKGRDPANSLKLLFNFLSEKPPELLADDLKRANWKLELDAAAKYYEPGRFTTFAAYEWSSMPNGANLHRNVVFRDRAPEFPFSSIDSDKPEALWAYLDSHRSKGIESLDIPHNSNASDGLMFDYKDSAGNPISREYAETRMRNEPIVEISQAKGTSETRPELSPQDEFAGFELWDHLLASTKLSKQDGSYVRQALRRGLEIDARVGANPFRYGFVGATDFHSGISSTEEDNFPGAHGLLDSQADPKKLLDAGATAAGESPTIFSAGALTGVWAESNTRAAIFDALKRREVFATSGNRIKVRVSAHWDKASGLVPMGSDLPARPAAAKAPVFHIEALKDPDGGALDRVQIVKVWYADGASQERVYDVLWAGDRKPDAQGHVPATPNTVDVKTGLYSNRYGATELVGDWRDSDFDAKASAAWYVRVLEVPTPRWTTLLAVRNSLPVPQGLAATIQERAWTSPIFFKP